MKSALVFILGAILGSFFNVCIYRIPRSISIVSPRSKCPFCDNPIKIFDNIPLISYLILKGKCRSCRHIIPARYFFVEIITSISALLLFWRFGDFSSLLVYGIFTSVLIIVSFIDLDKKVVPDIFTLPGIGAGLLLTTFLSGGEFYFYKENLINSLFGIFTGIFLMYLFGIIGERIFKKESIGGGDIKLMAMIGAFLGWKLTILTYFIAPVLGSVYGVYLIIKTKERVIPYAPYLSLGAFISLLYGDEILNLLFK